MNFTIVVHATFFILRKVFVHFGRSEEASFDERYRVQIPGKISLAVYRAVKMRQQPDFKFKIPVLKYVLLQYFSLPRWQFINLWGSVFEKVIHSVHKASVLPSFEIYLKFIRFFTSSKILWFHELCTIGLRPLRSVLLFRVGSCDLRNWPQKASRWILFNRRA